MTEKTTALGRLGEDAAEKFLTARGLRLLERNWRNGGRGELDLILRDQRQVVFVEVKTRTGIQEGSILEAVDARKLARLQRLAMAWLAAQPRWTPYRIDAVAVAVDPDSNRARISWLQGIDR